MNKREIVHTLMNHIQTGDFENARSLLANDFKFSGPIPTPINADEWIEMNGNLRTAFPDLNYNFNIIGEEGDIVRLTSQLSGTQSAPLDLTSMDMGVIPATNKAFHVGFENTEVTVRDNKVVAWDVEPSKDAGIMAILKQLGVEMPTPEPA